MTPEDAISYIETISRRHGFGGLAADHRTEVIRELAANPDIIPKFIEQSEGRIEQASAKEKT